MRIMKEAIGLFVKEDVGGGGEGEELVFLKLFALVERTTHYCDREVCIMT